ncbi:receptor protein kinase-like protein ZAR1 [Triticum dicoccoides]|uniref:receptor protein kinase-like protein ZAR1 n=1 Tax=Triticum dicoccoides TaxID=85692 RepID=UPI00188FEC3C|nr:receptor protein kinase-like protein ZAR1 [Triticum dicoccoides]
MRSLPHSSLGILLLPALLLVLAASPPAAPLSPDGLALLAFKAAVTDDPTSALSAWSANDTDPCRWPGVACVNTSSTEARVAGLAVAGKNLSGRLPPELGSLSLLRRLNLHGNRLSGAVPPALSNATSLRSVFLYDNNLTGAFPAFLCDLPRLQNLDLSKNALAGPLPPALGRCRQLQRLLLANNGFSGRIPAAALPQMESLQLLDLSSNSLTGAIPPELGKLQALAGTLNVSRNRLSGAVPPELGRLPATVTLDLRFNNLSGEIPQSGSLASQGPTAFLNNPGLCGFPLQVPCRAAPPSASSSTPPPTTTGSGGSAGGGPSQPMKTSLIVLISVADAAGVALIGVIVVYIYWKLRDRRGDGGGDDEDEEGRGLFFCPCMRANTCGDSSEGSDAGGDGEKKRGNGSGGGGGGGEDGELVAIDKGFRMELDELLRSSAYVLGKGGKGIVYKVVVGNGTTPVAVRRLGGGTAAPERYKEFAAEAGAVGRVRHANVVRLRAYYWSPDEKLVVTDFINNGNLASALRGRSGQPSLSWSLRLRIAKGAARGLAHLHECSPRRYVHGEVKPSNILLDADYNALVSDFGLARLLTIAGCADAAGAGTGGIMGCALPYVKPPAPDRPNAYRAPEARVPGSRPSQKSDVYSFGVLLLELLTGRSPEQASPSGSSASFSGPGAAAAAEGQQAPEIVRWVRQGFEDARPLSELADDAVLRDAGARKEVVAAFHVALGCVEADLERRPRMKAVADSLDKIGS